jgi:hypothetical protein
MEKLKKLEINKLIRELEYIESDYEYKSEVLQSADVDFLSSVNKVVSSHSELKRIYDDKVNQLHLKNIESVISKEEVVNMDELPKGEIDPKLKLIYRSIVKKTHPDKVGDDDLKNIYIDSTKFYENGDIISLYKICDSLKIEYDIEESDYSLIQGQIQRIKDKIQFLESTFTWIWLNADDRTKEEVVLNFVRLQIS